MKQKQCGARFRAIEQLADAPRTNSAHLSSDAQPDADLARVVDRRGDLPHGNTRTGRMSAYVSRWELSL